MVISFPLDIDRVRDEWNSVVVFPDTNAVVDPVVDGVTVVADVLVEGRFIVDVLVETSFVVYVEGEMYEVDESKVEVLVSKVLKGKVSLVDAPVDDSGIALLSTCVAVEVLAVRNGEGDAEVEIEVGEEEL